MNNTTAPNLTHPSGVISSSLPTFPVYVQGMMLYGMEYPFIPLTECPAPAPSQLLVHLLTGGEWETEKSLTWDNCYSATKPSAFYQHYSHTKSNTQLCTG